MRFYQHCFGISKRLFLHISFFNGTKSHYVKKQNICGLPCLQKPAVHSARAEKRQESENVTGIDFAVYHSVNHFVEWKPKLNLDEMNVLINWQSGADMRLIENV